MTTIASTRQGRLRPSSAAQKGSLFKRCNRLEENMMKNLEVMRNHRQMTDLIKQKKQEEAEKQLKDMQETFKNVLDMNDLQDLTTTEEAVPVGSAELGDAATPRTPRSMKERCEMMEQNLTANKKTLDGHRKFLDSVHALRGGKPEATEQPSETAVDRSRMIEENARWMGRSMQAAAVSKARSSSASARPATAPGGSRSGALASDASGAAQLSRPMSSSRPVSQASNRSWSASRPGSAGCSMKARCRALEDNLKKNKMVLQENRQGIDLVVKLRREKQEKVAEDLMKEMQAAFGFAIGHSSSAKSS